MKKSQLMCLMGGALFLATSVGALAADSACVECHTKVTPAIVKDFKSGEMGKSGSVDCSDCHGKGHTSAQDVANVKLPTQETCARCHKQQADQYGSGKHALSWVAMSAMPKTGFQPHAYI